MSAAPADRSDQLWSPADPLDEVLHLLRMRGVVYCRCEFGAPWGLRVPPMPGCLMFHIVTVGGCHLELQDGERHWLAANSVALVPHGDGHRLLSAPDAPAPALFDLPYTRLSERYELLRHGGSGAPTRMVCVAVRFDQPAAQRLVAALPPLLCVDAAAKPYDEWMRSTLQLIAFETAKMRAGGEAIVTRLADILVIQAIRAWIATAPGAQAGWLGALRDRQIGQALALLHREPTRDWTVASLAAAVAMSRSAFAARFRQLVGDSAMRYLARWRMHVAAQWLTEERTPIATLASRLGYESEAAFNRAFKRSVGVTPGTLRRRSAAGEQPLA